jgi:Ca-activated chloride channel homolog
VRLLRPEMAVWLFAVPVAVVCWALHYQYKWRQRARAVDGPRGAALSRRSRPGRDTGALTLGIITIALLAGAVMRPQILVETRTPQFERLDLILIMDRSVSMRARDIRPSRFGWAVDEIKRFLRRKPDGIGRVGLVGFAATPVVLSYPTRDLDSLFFYLDWLRDDPTPMFGTDVGAALTRALEAARRDPQNAAPLFVLVSDGDDQGTQLERAAAALRPEGIRVHTIGIGSQARVTIPVMTGAGREELLRDERGNLVTTTFSASSLQRVAGITGGRYIRSVAGGELLSAFGAITEARQRQIGWTTTMEFRDLYLYLLTAAGLSGLAFLTRL